MEREKEERIERGIEEGGGGRGELGEAGRGC